MNKTAIKNFAIWARNKLIADISYRAGLMGITVDGIQKALPQSTGTTEFYDIGTAEPYSISGDAVKQRKHLVELIRRKEKETNYKIAYKYVLEEVAYTWFNRLIAVRFMEVNDYLPSHIRVLSSDSGKMEPDLVTTPFDAELAFSRDEEQTIYQLKQENKIDEVFRILFIKQCNALNEILPALFEKTSDYTELLLNLSVIDQDGVVYHLVHDIPEEDFDVERGGQVEIIGWLYQYYNTEPKNEAFAKSGKISKEEIPAVTQLFTPDWIVRYMVENSVGRLWIEHLRALNESVDEAALASSFGWKYYMPEAEQEPEVEAKLNELRKERVSLTPEQITIIDPCMGSGHILVYAFDVLMQIYENAGYGQRDAAISILENNLYGLDIDDRAYQMAYFAVMMKAREYNRRILNGDTSCKVYAIQESNGISDASLGDMGATLSEEDHKKALKEIKALIAEFKDAKEYGSILNIGKRNWDLLRRFAVPNVQVGQLTLDMNGVETAAERLQEIINIADVMASKYYITCTNPPYMGIGNMGNRLYDLVVNEYEPFKQDLYCVFVLVCSRMLKNNGLQAMITQQSFMFNSRFEKMRSHIINYSSFENLIYLGTRAFEDISGEKVRTCTFVIRKPKINGFLAKYADLQNEDSEVFKRDRFMQMIRETFDNKKVDNLYLADIDQFNELDGATFSYWISKAVADLMIVPMKTDYYLETRHGLVTGNGEKFMRLWHECDVNQIGIFDNTNNVGLKWYPYNKGGSFRRWYGNREYVVNWQHNGMEIRNYKENDQLKSSNYNLDYNFKPNISWSDIKSGLFSARYTPEGSLFDTSGPSLFLTNIDNTMWILGLLNTKVCQKILEVSCTGLHYTTGAVANIPVIDSLDKAFVAGLAETALQICKDEWDSFENSWDYKRNPLASNNVRIKDAYETWKKACEERFSKLKETEEKLNKYVIEIYGLQDELLPALEDQEITIRRADVQRDIKALLSYSVGCMFGRYSLDHEGLAYAGGNWDTSKYSAFIPDADNVIPITDEEYLEDDIVSRLCSWLKVAFGESTLEENLDFIAMALGNKGSSSREIIRNYFLNDFFKDHCQTYSVTGSGKRPIYWLFDSGKQNGFKALIYLHRYNADTIGNLRIDYLHRMQRIYESEISRMQDMIDHSTSSREVAQATKRREKLTKQLKECREYDEKMAHLALSRIELYLDDGVKINYRKVQTASDGKYYEVLADAKNIMANDKLWKQYKEGKW